MRYLVIDSQTQTIVNVIIWDGESEYSPGDGFELHPDNGQAIGEVYQK